MTQPFAIAREGRVHLRQWCGGHYPAGLGEVEEWRFFLNRLATKSDAEPHHKVMLREIKAAEKAAEQWRNEHENV